ncbi:hypothetical protein I7I50_00134 [Histoplasma capsulatum G186AR]|uniref:Uncharacterized protein n=1 Tax=Ajellomyces capsulatus TaxID=5037 RepID=A0A8H7YIK5_AJECA|nr:hypothetical protein I7I52_07403 [Histoplasma capsulatum]QSS72324.1 hypothetical protein I7I50_00134 [Histoplasma capsulatum G186AR]
MVSVLCVSPKLLKLQEQGKKEMGTGGREKEEPKKCGPHSYPFISFSLPQRIIIAIILIRDLERSDARSLDRQGQRLRMCLGREEQWTRRWIPTTKRKVTTLRRGLPGKWLKTVIVITKLYGKAGTSIHSQGRAP